MPASKIHHLPPSTVLTLQKPTYRPLPYAAGVAATYLVLCVLYIRFSTSWAARLATNKEELASYEQIKGMLFVALSSLLIGALVFWLLRHIARHEHIQRRQNIALIEMESRAMAGVFAAGIAHDINNMIMPMHGLAWKLSADKAVPDSLQADVARMKECVELTTQLAKRLMKSGREVSGTWEPVEVETLVGQTIAYARMHPKVMGCKIEVQGHATERCLVNAQLIHQMLLNLVLNAADATNSHGRIRVSLRREQGRLLLAVEDDGPGIPEAKREKVFAPFFSTKADGTGLGLVSVKTCAEMHGGEVTVRGSELGGAYFLVSLPMLPPRVRQGSGPSDATTGG